MKQPRFLPAVVLLALAACDDKPTHVFVESPSQAHLSGVWTGVAEITTDDDLSWNTTYSDNRGFSFPVVIQFGDDGIFRLSTANFSTSYDNEAARTCTGVYSKSNASLQFFPDELCRALPLTKFTIGRVLPGGITLEARTGSTLNPAASFVSMRVRFRLDPE
jgi:hypothetical protein